MSRARVVCVVVVLLASCASHDAPSGSSPSTGTTAPTKHAPPSAMAPPPMRGYEVHEWGLLAFSAFDADDVVASASPIVETAGHGGGGTGSAYKPVLYIQLAPQTTSVTFDAEVRSPAHAFAESWPVGATSGDTLRWAHVEATAAPASGCGAHYPTEHEAPCATSLDGYCEAMNAARYEASDGACLSFGGAKYDHLLYRATVPRDALPFEVARAPNLTFTVRAKPDAPFVQLWRVRRDFTSTRVWAAAFHSPQPGGEAPMPEPTEFPGARVLAQILGPMLLARLTAPERAAFASAWRDAIVPEGTPSQFTEDRVRRLLAASQPPADALYFWLPAELADRVLPLHFAPAPNAVRRALLVRIALEPPRPTPSPLLSHADVTSPIDARGLDAEVVRRVVRRHVNEINYCHQQAGGGLRVLNLNVGLTAEGATTDVRVDSQIDVPAFDRCVVQRVATWVFPVPSPVENAGFSMGIGMTSVE